MGESNRVAAVVTGALGGIGSALCRAFREEGYVVVGIDRSSGEPDADHHFHFDIAGLKDGEQNAERGCQQLQEILHGRLTVLVNNAAIQIVKPVAELAASDWDATLNTNLLAPFFLIQRFLPELRAARGSVVNIASIHANVTKAEFAAYATSKGALVSMTKALAIELAPEVRVNAIIPAATDTPMLRAGFADNPGGLAVLGSYHPLRRIARADEVAGVATFLASDKASFISGAALNVDGGIGACLHDPVVAR